MDLILIWQYFVVFVFAVMLGSFLNVLILRINENIPWWSGRSRCPVCKKELEWYELLPIFSFIVQRGECRNCKTPISWQYPLIELASGLIGIACLHSFGFNLESLLIFILAYFMLGSFTSDLKFMEIPELFTYGAIVISILYVVFYQSDYRSVLIGAAVGTLFFLIQFIATKGEGIGLADVKLGLAMGIFLGWPLILVMILLSYIVASIILIPLIISKKLNLKSAVPLGVFLIPTFLVFIFFLPEVTTYVNMYFPFTTLISL